MSHELNVYQHKYDAKKPRGPIDANLELERVILCFNSRINGQFNQPNRYKSKFLEVRSRDKKIINLAASYYNKSDIMRKQFLIETSKHYTEQYLVCFRKIEEYSDIAA